MIELKFEAIGCHCSFCHGKILDDQFTENPVNPYLRFMKGDKKRLIVKLQLSTGGNAKARQMLIYDKSRKYQFQSDASEEIIQLMNGRLKVFFYADIVDNQFGLGEEAPDQDW